jgi:hypothetical protein
VIFAILPSFTNFDALIDLFEAQRPSQNGAATAGMASMADRKAQFVTPLTHQARGAAGRVSDDPKNGLDLLVRFRRPDHAFWAPARQSGSGSITLLVSFGSGGSQPSRLKRSASRIECINEHAWAKS